MTYYMDEIEKIKYLRGRIAGSLVSSGALPDRGLIDERLSAIDTKLAVFRCPTAKESEKFNVQVFNEACMDIYQDLSILYQLTKEFAEKKLELTKAYIEMHLSHLENMTELYNKKSKLEMGETSIGTTIFFQTSGFSQKTRNDVTRIELGNIKTEPGASLAFFIGGKNFMKEDVIFYLGSQKAIPFALSEDRLKIPGHKKYTSYECSYPKDVARSGMFALVGSGLIPRPNGSYIVYGGKDTVLIREGTARRYLKKEDGEPISLNSSKGVVSFYTHGGSYLNFSFNKQPKAKNFSGNAVSLDDVWHKFSLEYDGQFSFDVKTDAEIYAERKNGIVSDGQLFYPSADPIDGFLVDAYETQEKDSVTLPLSVHIRQNGEEEPMVTMVLVKELNGEDDGGMS